MSLVVAQLTGNGPRIVSDTWVSFPHESKSNPKMGTLKAIIVTSEIAICFAGNVSKGLKGIRRFADGIQANQSVEDLLPHLVELSLPSEYSSDFIVASAKPNSKLIRIRDGKIERGLETAWIGDQDGFQRFQEEREKLSNNVSRSSFHNIIPLSVFSESQRLHLLLVDAMKAVIEDNNIETVDGFCVSIAAEKLQLNYTPSTFVHVGRDFQVRPEDDLFSKMVQPVAEGGYSISIVEPVVPGTPALCLNFPQARLGMIFLPLKYDEAQVVRDVSPKDFSKIVFERYGIAINDPLLR